MKPTDFLQEASSKYPQYKDLFSNLGSMYQQQLWHQITMELDISIIQSAQPVDKDLLLGLYEHFILDFYRKMNLLKFSQLTVIASEQIEDVTAAIEFLKQGINNLNKLNFSYDIRVEKTYEPILFLEMRIAYLYSMIGNFEESKTLIEQGKVKLDSYKNVDPVVAAGVFYAASMYHKSNSHYGDFYRNALLYLCFRSSDSIPEDQKLTLAMDICYAALLAPDIYNFGELTQHPIMESLKNSSNAWLYEVIVTFYNGDLLGFKALGNKYKKQFSQQPALKQKAFEIQQKITILTFMQLISSRSPDDRKIALKDISSTCQLDQTATEFLIMKTLSLHLIEGVIDSVDETVQVSWVQPRVMMHDQIQGLKLRLNDWLIKVKDTQTNFYQQSIELAEY